MRCCGCVPAAALRASSLGAHREAAAQYDRVLRFGQRLPPAERAELLERRSRECYHTDQYDDGIAALEEALECRRTISDTLNEGEVLRRLSEFLWCPGRTQESERCAREAVALLETLPPSRELALAHANLAGTCAAGALSDEGSALGERALDLAERLHDTETAIYSLATIGWAQDDYQKIEQSLEQAQRAQLDGQVVRAFSLLSATAITARRHHIASMYLEPGLAYASDRGFELHRLYLLAYRARFELDQGHWAEAAASAETVKRIPRTSTPPRIISLVVLALANLRRSQQDVWPLLDEAWTTGRADRGTTETGPVSAARAEAAWLTGRQDTIQAETDATYELALSRDSPWLTGELAYWRAPVQA